MIDVQSWIPNVTDLAIQINKFVSILDDKLEDQRYHFELADFEKLLTIIERYYLDSERHAHGRRYLINLAELQKEPFMSNDRYEVRISFATYPKHCFITYPSTTIVSLTAETDGTMLIDNLGYAKTTNSFDDKLHFQFNLPVANDTLGLEAHSVLFFAKTKDCFTEIKKLF